MHKIKAAIKALRTHLHRDLQGINLLDDVTKIANELRTENRAIKEQCKSLSELVSNLREQLQLAELASESLHEELQSEQRATRKLQLQVKHLADEKHGLERQLEPSLCWEKISSKKTPAVQQFVSTFKSLRSVMPVPPPPCPIPTGKLRHGFELSDFIDFKNPDYTRLGMFVSVLCLLDWVIAFTAEEKMDLVSLGKDSRDGGEVGKLLRWVKRNWFAKEAEWKERVYENSNYAQDKIESKFW